MILAAGLSPAWQYVLIFSELHAGEVNRARQSMWFASGKAINVGLALHHLGAEARTLSPVGGTMGELLQKEFASTGAQARWVRTESATRICTTLIDNGKRQTTELVENSPAISPAEFGAYEQAFAEEASAADVVVLSGSLPTGASRDYYRQLILRAPSSPSMTRTAAHARLVLDIRGPELQACLPLRPFLVKPNREELATTVGRSLPNENAVLAAMKELNQAGAEWVLVTNGQDPAFLTSRTAFYRLRPPEGAKVVNPIGCGDSVAAGIAWGLSQNLEAPECVRLGFGAAAANLEQMSSARFQRQRAEDLAAGVTIDGV